MNAIKSKMLIGTGLVALGLLSAVFAQGMMGQQGNTAQGQNAQGMMGGMMGGGMGMMNTYAASSRPISQDEARRRAEGFAARYGQGVKIRDFMIFTDNFYVQVVNSKTGAGLGELLVDRYTGVVQPEYGPNMMWNTRFGMGGSGMMGSGMNGQQNQTGMMGDQNQQGQQGQGMMGSAPNSSNQVAQPVRYNLASAQKLAATFVAGYLPDGKVIEGFAFPGYYTFDYGRKAIEGMLSVNAYTGEVWLHGWHGLFLGEIK
jgi:hypothetical protein